MKVAVASSGLGHVARGIESWAWDTAVALARRPPPGAGDEPVVEAALFAGGDRLPAAEPGLRVCVLPCWHREQRLAQRLASSAPGPAWRWGWRSAYGWEQFSFWWRLWPRLRQARFDLLHVQDPMLAYWCRVFRRAGLLPTREILAHGTEEPPEFLRRFEYVQHLTPWHREQAESADAVVPPGRRWTVIPNFVDTARFRPAGDTGARRAARERWGVPADALVLGCVAALKKEHKRLDYLIREFAEWRVSSRRVKPFLLMAGARTPDTAELHALAHRLAAPAVRMIADLPRDAMPELYRALDVFVLPSLFEMLPIAILEAMASGLPVLTHRQPALQWIVGTGGAALDFTKAGALADFFRELPAEWLAASGLRARARAEEVFARDVVVAQYRRYYGEVLAA